MSPSVVPEGSIFKSIEIVWFRDVGHQPPPGRSTIPLSTATQSRREHLCNTVGMAESLNPPLSYEASATTTHPHEATSLPSEVVACLKNSRFVR